MNRVQPHLPPGWNKHPPLPVHPRVPITSVLPGWQIAVIAAVVALLAALAVALYRTRVARPSATTSAT